MGVERAVTRWYILRQPIMNEISALESRLQQLALYTTGAQDQEASAQGEGAQAVQADSQSALFNELEQQLRIARARLKTLGPCQKPMMG